MFAPHLPGALLELVQVPLPGLGIGQVGQIGEPFGVLAPLALQELVELAVQLPEPGLHQIGEAGQVGEVLPCPAQARGQVGQAAGRGIGEELTAVEPPLGLFEHTY